MPKQDLPGEQCTKLLTSALLYRENRWEGGPEPGFGHRSTANPCSSQVAVKNNYINEGTVHSEGHLDIGVNFPITTAEIEIQGRKVTKTTVGNHRMKRQLSHEETTPTCTSGVK